MDLQNIEDDGKAMQALSESDEYVMMILKKKEDGGNEYTVWSSSLCLMPFAIDILERRYKQLVNDCEGGGD